jgi:hypothetical protein
VLPVFFFARLIAAAATTEKRGGGDGASTAALRKLKMYVWRLEAPIIATRTVALKKAAPVVPAGAAPRSAAR